MLALGCVGSGCRQSTSVLNSRAERQVLSCLGGILAKLEPESASLYARFEAWRA